MDKWCPKRKHFVSRDGFQKNGDRGDGLQTYCKECRSEYDAGRIESNRRRYRRWCENNLEHKKLYDKQYREANLHRISAQKRGYRQNNLEKISADSKKRYKEDKQSYNERSRKYRQENLESIKANGKKYYQENKEQILQQTRKYYHDNHTRMVEVQRAYYQNNKERAKIHSKNRKARKKSAAGRYTLQQWRDKLEYFGHRCYLCRDSLEGKIIHADHRKPISRGGSNWIANIAPACARCNLRKNNKTESEYRNYLLTV